MKTIITLITITVFCIIVYKKKLSPLFSRQKEKKGTENGSHESGNGNTDSDTKNHPLPGSSLIPVTGLTGSSNMRYEVAVFDYSECETAAVFSDYIEARLTVLTAQLDEKGYPYRIDFITIGTALIALITYQT